MMRNEQKFINILPTHPFFRQLIYVIYILNICYIQILKKTPFLQNIPLVLVSVYVRQAVYNCTSFFTKF